MQEKIDRIILQNKLGLAEKITELHFQKNPDLDKKYGDAGRDRCQEDACYHLEFLAEALAMDHPEIYGNYILWAAGMLEARKISRYDLEVNLIYIERVLQEFFGKREAAALQPYFALARQKLNLKVTDPGSFFRDENPLKKEAEQYLQYLLNADRQAAARLINKLVDQGKSVKDIYLHIFQVTQYEVGLLWQCNHISVAHEHYCTAATQLIMAGLYPKIFSSPKIGKRMVACSIAGELHEMGIRMLADIFEMEGWDTFYLGANMPHVQLLEALNTYRADLLAISVTLPTHVSHAGRLIQKIRCSREFGKLKILVGGYPFKINAGLWKKVGADGFAENADGAVLTAKRLVDG
ncbi:Methanogenic corrinoid protein MtbC1 [Cyclobacterium lianum]|uniref:Methanogenic corrinoid protein MtbC1 n=1 Tax=Cyclobacterium lianum TaxID=388280 RepID=A0A1M7LI34_9BACT|nr:cobalamin-dependent protein [Cyclobacterium lianum]SHM77793.1 Methanogenic corrinoid protein MtbC1 [Cyclobacterium lianum]